jgi:uncharacterized repeat protein (TIGR01451 family)
MGSVLRFAAVVVLVAICGMVGVSRGAATVTSTSTDPPLTAEQLNDLHAVTDWHITESSDYEVSGSGSGKVQNGPYTWSGSDSESIQWEGDVDVHGPAGCLYNRDRTEDCVPIDGSGTLDEDETWTSSNDFPLCGDPPGFTESDDTEINGSSEVSGYNGSYFSIDYSTNPPTTYADIGYSVDGTDTFSESPSFHYDPDFPSCGPDSSTTNPISDYWWVYFFPGTPSAFNKDTGDTQVQVEGDMFVVHDSESVSTQSQDYVPSFAPDPIDFSFPATYTTTVDWTATAPIPSADVAVTKSGPLTARPGNTLTYTITATNKGPSDTNTFSLQDPIPANTTFVSATQTSGPPFQCPFNSLTDTVVCEPGGASSTFADGASATFLVVVKVNAGVHVGTTIQNTATVNGSLTDPDTSNNTATVDTVIATKGPDLAVAKSGPASVVAGKEASYSLRVTNTGSSAMLDDTLTDALPAGATFVSLTQTAGVSPDDCTEPSVGSSGTVTCSFSQLQTAESAQFKLVVAVDPALANYSTLVNTATVSSDSVDTNNADDTATVQSLVTTSADLLVTAKAPPTAVAGRAVDYTLTLRNKGPSVGGAVLRDYTSLPASTTFVSLTQIGGTPAACTTPGVGVGGEITCTIASLPKGGYASFRLVYKALSSIPEGIVLADTASVSGTANDPDSSNNSATANTTITTLADLSLTKTGPASAVAGRSLAYMLTFRNIGPSDDTDVELSDPLPAGTTFVSLTQTGGTAASCTTPAEGSGGSITCGVASLPAHASASFRLVAATASSATPGTVLSNTATVAGAVSDPDDSNNAATVETTLSRSADLVVTNTAAPANVTRFHTLTFTIKLLNKGPSDAASIDLSDLLPAGTTFKSVSQVAGVTLSCTTPAVGGTGTVDCTVPTLAAHTSVRIKILVKATAVDGTVISDTATATSATPDPQPDDDSATATSTVGCACF